MTEANVGGGTIEALAMIRSKAAVVVAISVVLVWWVGGVAGQPTGPVKTIVLLVMENRSFDHFVGLMKKLNPGIDGLTGMEDNPVDPGDPSAARVIISDEAEFVDPDPGHEFEQVAEQIYGSLENVHSSQQPSMEGFVAQAERVMPGLSRRVMSAFRPEVVPVTTSLAMNFALFDRWYPLSLRALILFASKILR